MTNKSSSQNGSAHVVIIVLIIAAILAGLGYVFFTRYFNHKDVASDSSVPAPSSDLVFADLGITVPVQSSAGYQVTKDSEPDAASVGSYSVTTAAVSSLCKLAGSTDTGASVGHVLRYRSDASGSGGLVPGNQTNKQYIESTTTAPNAYVESGDYIYLFSSVQQGCGDPSTDVGKQANTTQSAAVSQFSGDFKQLHVN